MTDSLPTAEAVDAHVAAFERDLAAAPSVNDAKLLRDRYLGRKHSVVASWMQLIGSAPADQKKNIGQHANALKVAIEARWKAYEERAQNAQGDHGNQRFHAIRERVVALHADRRAVSRQLLRLSGRQRWLTHDRRGSRGAAS